MFSVIVIRLSFAMEKTETHFFREKFHFFVTKRKLFYRKINEN